MRGLDPRIHTMARHAMDYVRFPPLHRLMDGRVIGERSDAVLRTAMPGHDVDGLVQTNWKAV
jgi:hypothetical protein